MFGHLVAIQSDAEGDCCVGKWVRLRHTRQHMNGYINHHKVVNV